MGDDILATTVAVLINLVIAGGTIGSIIALLLTGHLILPIALVYGAAFLGAGVRINRESIETAIKKNLDIPGWVRFISLGDNRIDKICGQMSPELELSLKERMSHEREIFDELIAKVGQELKRALFTKAEEAIILIQ